MTEPRRLAVVGVANRVASLCGEDCGATCGYRIHLDNCVSDSTRIEVVTEAILVRLLQKDPFLEDFNVVVLDEFHERSIYTDLALAFLKEAVAARDDLFVVVMSATIDTERLQNYLSESDGIKENVPVLKIPGRTFPVEVEYEPTLSVEDAVLRELKGGGSILVFLPGIADIRRTEQNLLERMEGVRCAESNGRDDIHTGGEYGGVELCVLHSSISLDQQRHVLTPPPQGTRRVILSSSIAETSLTVPDVKCVIDSGLARVARMNVATGMSNLVTEIESDFSAEQRKGRAGRISSGRCIRLWSAAEPRVKNMPPEILRSDITTVILECAERGSAAYDKTDFLDRPTENAWTESQRLLEKLDFIQKNDDGVLITKKGRASLVFPLSPRLANIVLSAGKKNFDKVKKLVLENSPYAKSSENLQHKFLIDIEKKLSPYGEFALDVSDNAFLLYGYPDRLAFRISDPGEVPARYQFTGGKKAVLKDGVRSKNGAREPEWLVAFDVMAGKSEAVIYSFEAIKEETAKKFCELNSTRKIKCAFVDGKLSKTEQICFGEFVLKSTVLKTSDEDFALAWTNEIKERGLGCLPMDERTKKFLLRAKLYREMTGIKNTAGGLTGCAEKDEAAGGLMDGVDLESELTETAETWLVPFLTEKKVSPKVVYDALYWYLDGAKVDAAVPETFVLPNGRRVKVVYEEVLTDGQKNVRPVIEVIIQRIFGCFETPVIAGKKVLLRLLSPASRPLQITDDLEHFWTGAWPEICREMKGRYPKHNWDYRVAEEDR